jgi:hypothetical protein
VNAPFAIALGMAVGSGGTPSYPRVPLPFQGRSGFVPLVEWPDGAQIGRVLEDAFVRSAEQFAWAGDAVWLVDHEPDLMHFVYVDPKGALRSFAIIQEIVYQMNLASSSEQRDQLVQPPSDLTEQKRWRWFLFDHLGIPLDVEEWTAFWALGFPKESTPLVQAVEQDPELRRTIGDIEEGRWGEDWEWFNGAMLTLGKALDLNNNEVRYSLKVEGQRYGFAWMFHVRKWAFTSAPHSVVIYLIVMKDGTIRWTLRRYVSGRLRFRGQLFTSFYDMIRAHLLIEGEDTNPDALPSWLDANSDPGTELGNPTVLEAWELLMGEPLGLLSNPDLMKYAQSQGLMP